MAFPSPLDMDSIRRLAKYLRTVGAPVFTSTRYTTDIDPWWLATPLRRGVLWEAIARMVALEERDA